MDITEHRVVPLRGFDELKLGEVFNLPSRTIGDANFAAFQTVSLDNHPIHYESPEASYQSKSNLG